MKRMVRSAAIICLTVILSLVAAGCAGSSDSDQQAARVGQMVITEDGLNTYTAIKLYREGYDPSGTEAEQKKECLENMVDAEAIRQYYETNGTEIYDDSYNSGKESFVSEMQADNGEFLEQSNITYEDLVYYYRAQFVTGKLFEEIRAQHSEEEIDAEAQTYYAEHQENYTVEKAGFNEFAARA